MKMKDFYFFEKLFKLAPITKLTLNLTCSIAKVTKATKQSTEKLYYNIKDKDN